MNLPHTKKTPTLFFSATIRKMSLSFTLFGSLYAWEIEKVSFLHAASDIEMVVDWLMCGGSGVSFSQVSLVRNIIKIHKTLETRYKI